MERQPFVVDDALHSELGARSKQKDPVRKGKTYRKSFRKAGFKWF